MDELEKASASRNANADDGSQTAGGTTESEEWLSDAGADAKPRPATGDEAEFEAQSGISDTTFTVDEAAEDASALPDDASGGRRYASRDIQELTVAELLVSLLQSPARTTRNFIAAMNSSSPRVAVSIVDTGAASQPTPTPERSLPTRRQLRATGARFLQAKYLQLVFFALAIVSALFGSAIVRGGRDALDAGAPYLWLGFLLWLAAELAGQQPSLPEKWRQLDSRARIRLTARIIPLLIWMQALFILAESMVAPADTAVHIAATALALFALGVVTWLAIDSVYWIYSRRNSSDAMAVNAPFSALSGQSAGSFGADGFSVALAGISRRRLILLLAAALSSGAVWLRTSGNYIEPPIIALWIVSAALWAFVFAPLRWNVFDWAVTKIDSYRRFDWRKQGPVFIALTLILILGASFRFDRLDTVPSELFSDLVEKIQDAHKIHHQNDYRIFLSNIGGREPIHFYLLSMLASQPGMNFDHFALKLMSALESFATIPLIFFLGLEVMGEQRRKLGVALGLVAASLVAVSFWHVVIGRQGMRISLAPLFVALTAIFYIRALRFNRRADFVKAGLALGFGLYGYQAVRMLPVPIVAGVLLTIAVGKYSWRGRASYLLNLAVLAFVSLMVFLPMLHFWSEYPDDYQRRASTRLFGDIPTSGDERTQALMESGSVFLRNIRNVLLVFNHTSDSTWVSSVPGEPAMDRTTGAFMVLGAAAWLALSISSRDPAMLAIPVLLLFMLLASALALAFPAEVPSFIRASGAIPPSYLMAALPVCIFSRQLMLTLPERIGKLVAAAFVCAVILVANHANTSLYFDRFGPHFTNSSHPYAQAGRIVKGFAESDGAYSNAILLATPHWWDFRAVGIEAEKIFWANGTAIEDLPEFLSRGMQRQDDMRLDPTRDLLFFLTLENATAASKLVQWFPQGRILEIEAHSPSRNFYLYRVPALGIEGLQAILNETKE